MAQATHYGTIDMDEAGKQNVSKPEYLEGHQGDQAGIDKPKPPMLRVDTTAFAK